MEVMVLIQLIFEMIADCRENQKRKTVKRRLRKPGVREAAALWRALRKKGLRGKELRETVEQTIADAKAASEQEIDNLIDEAEAFAADKLA